MKQQDWIPPPLLPPDLRRRLRGLRFVSSTGVTHGGVGERRSRSKGDGIEFEDFRPYTYGDDTRRIDPHVLARLGQTVIRQYNVPERLAITLLVDLSTSMSFGTPTKGEVSLRIAAGLALCALANGDSLMCACTRESSIESFPRLTGLGKLDELFEWIRSRTASGQQALLGPVTNLNRLVPAGGITVVISDMWDVTCLDAVNRLREYHQHVVVIRPLTPAELDPRVLGSGLIRLVDSESGEEVEIELREATLASYRSHFARLTASIRDTVTKAQGQFIELSTEDSLTDLFEVHLREARVIT
ncbi:MAG: DUF58 domain-containing protein [Trueperaceae bacterium]|nr:DUF58 domain-containing protein [Trueperaceae bacterium]